MIRLNAKTPIHKKTTPYPGKPLAKKLGIPVNSIILVVGSPDNYLRTLGQLPEGVVLTENSNGSYDFVHFFTKRRTELERKFPVLKSKVSLRGILWISWSKASSKMHTDLNENVVREIGLANGMVDVKVVAINEDWSALKFVRRLRDREDSRRAEENKFG